MNPIDFFRKQDNERSAAIRKIQSEREESFKAMFYDVLETVLQNPAIEGFHVKQGTPSFNDGDACRFGIYAAFFVPKFDNEEEEDCKFDDEHDLKAYFTDPDQLKLAENFAAVVYNADDCMESVFGNNVKLYFTMKNGQIHCESDWYEIY